jgi:hypothetical protein
MFASDCLRQGFVPWWNPHTYCGQPFVGNVLSAVFYPFNWLALLLPIGVFFLVSAWFHLTLLGSGMFLLLRSHGLRFGAALAGAVVMMLNTYVVGWLHYAPLSQWTFAWLPLLVWSWRRAYLARQPMRLAWPALLLGVVCLGGHLQIALYVGLAWGVIAGVHLAWERDWRAVPAYLLLPAAIGGMLAAIQILPALEATALSGRTGGSYADLAASAVPLRLLSTLLVPWFFGNNVLDPVSRPVPYWGPYTNAIEASISTGVAAVCLAVAALVWRRERAVWLYAGLAALALLLALRSPLYYVFWRLVPGFDALRGLARVLCLWNFALAALTGFGVQALAAPRSGGPCPRRTAALLCTGVLVAVLLALGSEAGRAGPDTITAFTPQLTGFVLRQCGLALAVTLAVAVIMWRRRGGRWLAVLPLLELFVLGYGNYTAVRPDVFFFPTAETALLQSRTPPGRMVGVPVPGGQTFLDWMPMNTPLAFGLSSPAGSESLSLQRYRKLAAAFVEPGWEPRLDSPLLDLVGVRTAISRRDLSGVPGWRLAGGERAGVFVNQQALPPLFAASAAKAVPPEAALVRLSAPDFQPGEVILRGDSPADAGITLSTAAVVPFYCAQPTTQRWLGRGRCPTAGWVVLTTARAPGWRAYVNRRPARIVTADYAFQAVAVPAGEVEVRFVYDPVACRAGVFVSLLGGLLLITWTCSCWGPRERHERGAAGPPNTGTPP